MSEGVSLQSENFIKTFTSLAINKAFYKIGAGGHFLAKQDMGAANYLYFLVNTDTFSPNFNRTLNQVALHTFIFVFDQYTSANGECLAALKETCISQGFFVDFIAVDLDKKNWECISSSKPADKKLIGVLDEAVKSSTDEVNVLSTPRTQQTKIIRRGISPVIIALVVINVAVFAVGYLMELRGGVDLFKLYGILSPELVREGEWWRLITAMFLHADIMHIFGNMYFLLMLGRALSPKYSSIKILVLYILSGVAGTLLSCTLSGALSLGASGAIMGLGGVLVYEMSLGREKSFYRHTMNVTNIAIMVIYNLGYGVVINQIGGNIDNFGHFGGFISGFILAFASDRIFKSIFTRRGEK